MKLSLRSFLYNVVFHETCPICNRNSYWKVAPFCSICWNAIEPFSSNRIFAGQFHGDFWKYIDSLSSFGAYDGVIKEAIHCFKYGGVKRVGKELGRLLGSIMPPEIDILIPVPLHIKKLRTREFNQSAVLAKELSKIWKISLSLTILVKIKDNIEQASLEANDRYINVKNAYAVTNPVKGIKAGLVDDVVTTGATLMECAKVLKKAGAKEIHAITLAKTI